MIASNNALHSTILLCTMYAVNRMKWIRFTIAIAMFNKLDASNFIVYVSTRYIFWTMSICKDIAMHFCQRSILCDLTGSTCKVQLNAARHCKTITGDKIKAVYLKQSFLLTKVLFVCVRGLVQLYGGVLFRRQQLCILSGRNNLSHYKLSVRVSRDHSMTQTLCTKALPSINRLHK